jgi:hypothetical protein
MTSPVPPPPQLTPQNFQELEAARRRLKGIRRAVGAARLEGYSIAVCGGFTVLFGIGSWLTILGGAVLTAIGVIEIVAAGQLRRLDERGPRILGINQGVLAVLIVFYALWSLHAESSNPNRDLQDLSPSDAAAMNQMMGPAMDIEHSVMELMYGSLIVAAIFEGGMAWYYYSKGPQLREYLAETPEWITQMQKAGVTV